MKSLLLLIFIGTPVLASIQRIDGVNPVTKINNTVIMSEQKNGTVVIFLSATCPCSDSHISYINELSTKFPKYQFIGIHSNVDEGQKITKEYFSKKNLKFPIIEDQNSDYANKLGASRTPHAYLISKEGHVLYQGGVTNSSKADNASEFYLFDALTAQQNDKKITVNETRVLGCEISRF